MLAATIVAARPQEHERALGGWQAEMPTLAVLIEALGSAVQAMDEVTAGPHDRCRCHPSFQIA